MQDEESIRSLEQRLQEDAQKLLNDGPEKSLIANLHNKCVQRRRRRILVRAVSAASIVAVAGVIGTIWLQRSRNIEKMANESEGLHATNSIVLNETIPPDGNLSEEFPSNFEMDDLRNGAVPVLFSQMGQDGKPEFAMGWYIPEQVEEIEAVELSPAERDAISRLLGPEPEQSQDETI
jgi:hypothetical protein